MEPRTTRTHVVTARGPRTQAIANTAILAEPWEKAVTISALVAALVALPLPPVSHAPEIAATLAVGAIAAMVGLRWGVAVLALTDAFLVAALWPIVAHGGGGLAVQVPAALACAAAAPGLFWIGRAAPHALELLGVRRSPRAHRQARAVMTLGAVVLVALPLF